MEASVCRQVCDRLNAWDGVPCLFLPESRETTRGAAGLLSGKRLPTGAVLAVAGQDKTRLYVDGSASGEVPFAVVYCTGTDPGEGLAALDFLASLTRYLEDFTPVGEAGRRYGPCRRVSLPVREREKAGGLAEYRVTFAVPWRQGREA